MTNTDSGRACSLSDLRQALDRPGVTAMPLPTMATALDQPVPISLSDLPTVAVKIDLDQTLPIEPGVLAQLCAQTQVSERRRVLPSNLEYSVHVLVDSAVLPPAAAEAALPPGPLALQRVSGLQLLALILGPLLGLLLGAGAAWQLGLRSKRSHRLHAATVPHRPEPTPARPRPQRPDSPPRPILPAPAVLAASAESPAPQEPAKKVPAVATAGTEAGPEPALLAAAVMTEQSGRPTPTHAAKPVAKTPEPAPQAGLEKLLSSVSLAEPARPPVHTDNLTQPAPAAIQVAAQPLEGAAARHLSTAADRPEPLDDAASKPATPGKNLAPAGPHDRAASQPGPAEPAPLRYLAGDKPQLPPLVRRLYGSQPVVGTYRVCVHPSGTVASVTALSGIPFDDEIQKTLRSWRFVPRTLAACIDQELHFEVDE